jgi:hypothetical protein
MPYLCYREIDEDKNQDFWKDIVIIVEDELHKLRKMDSKSKYQEAAERRQGSFFIVTIEY